MGNAQSLGYSLSMNIREVLLHQSNETGKGLSASSRCSHPKTMGVGISTFVVHRIPVLLYLVQRLLVDRGYQSSVVVVLIVSGAIRVQE
jgi:hypothetical protein